LDCCRTLSWTSVPEARVVRTYPEGRVAGAGLQMAELQMAELRGRVADGGATRWLNCVAGLRYAVVGHRIEEQELGRRKTIALTARPSRASRSNPLPERWPSG
jgi:hypothetical protein